MKLAIIIIHYGSWENTSACIKSVSSSDFPKEKIKIIIVNNDREIIEKMMIDYPKVEKEVINNSRNLGFAKAVNIGIRKALEDRNITDILLLNNDTVIQKNTLKELTQAKEDIVSPVVKFKYGNVSKYDYGGKINWLIGRPHHIELGIWNPELTFDVDYVSGCCMRVKKEVFDGIGLFDERFYFYFEDVDFCIRGKKAGFEVKTNPHTYINHSLSASIGKWSNRAIYYSLISNAKFIQKHLGVRRPVGFLYLFVLLVKIVLDKIR